MFRRRQSVALAVALAASCGGGCGDDGREGERAGQGMRARPDAGSPAASAGESDAGDGGARLDGEAASDVGADAARVWPQCEPMRDDSDGGVSPYDDECLFDEREGVFVDPDRGDDATGDGSRNRPFAGLRRAIIAATDEGKHVYACAGVYPEPLRIGTSRASGLRVYGGLSCETYRPEGDARSVVRVAGQGPALVIGETEDVVVERFQFEHVPAAEPQTGANAGASYVGGLVTDATRVVLRDVVLRAASGQDAAAAEPEQEPAASGVPGADGADACSADPNPGAGPVSPAQCAQSNATGGKGGDGGRGEERAGNGDWSLFAGSGGQGQDASGWSCEPGAGVADMPLSPGTDGQRGRGARGFGAFVAGRFSGFAGQSGLAGGPGLGGAGGGGARAPASCAGLQTATGASGGSGGSGGCGGQGGQGGSPGGSSFALISVHSSLRLEGGALEYGDGGRGGDGAPGQQGGGGAPGGEGGQGVAGASDACRGTPGAKGGAGGPGGGGNGGHAIGVLHLGQAPVLRDVEGEAAERRGGEPGEGPDTVTDTAARDMLRGSPGVSMFMREL